MLLTRVSLVAVLLGLVAACLGPVRVWPPSIEWLLGALRDVLLIGAGALLVSFGIRHTRRQRGSNRARAYPILGCGLLAVLLAVAVFQYTHEWSLIASLGENAPADAVARVEALSRRRYVILAVGAISILAGSFSRVGDRVA